MAFHWCEYFGGYTSSYCNTWTPSDWNSSITKPLSDFVIGDSPVAQVTSSMLPITWQITSRLKLTLTDASGQMHWVFYDENNNIIAQGDEWIGSDYNRYVIGFCVNDTTQEGVVRFGQYRRGTTSVYMVARPDTQALARNLYPYFSEAEQPPVVYNWQSVPSISGKNGILNLSQIASASINNGEAVSGASASAFTSLTAQVSTMVTDDSEMSGADAGGISGSGSNSGNQSSGYAFGQGESGTNVSGGGSGYYGGEKGGSLLSGGAGSGYIGNALVSNKKMVGYNVPTSSAEGTKTESVSVYSATKEANKPKAGNGFARIKFIKECTEKYIDNLMVSDTLNNVENKSTEQWGSPFHLGEWDNRLFAGSIGNGHTLHGASPGQNQSNLTYDSTNKQFTVSKNQQLTEGYLIPLQKSQDIYKLTFDVQLVGYQGYGWDTSLIGFVSTATGRFVTKTEKNILWMNNQTGETGEHVTDYNWHTFSYNLNLKNISYLGFSCANNQCRFKNIKIVSCDSV